MIAIIAEVGHKIQGFWFWFIFIAVVLTVMILDLGVMHRRARELRTRDAFLLVCVWVSLALAFNVVLFVYADWSKAFEFATGYMVEYSLSVDNLFVFVMIFTYFSVPAAYQHRVLFWGIVGAAIMRLLFIFVLYELVEEFGWLMYLFAAFLIFTGCKFLFSKEIEVHPEKNVVIKLVRRVVRVTPEFHGPRFFTRLNGRLFATPLFLVLIVVEATDVVFAVDSVPAIRGLTDDKFIAYTSNIFAILGLRSMYFLLAGIINKFHYLQVGLSLVLIFIGAKMCLQHFFHAGPQDSSYPIWTAISLGVVVLLLGGSVVLSLIFPAKDAPGQDEPSATD